MIPEMEKARVTEIQVRMDCNGCVQKIKKALHSINGICELYIDFPQQKITIIGWADPEKIVKAIKKTRKTAIICSHTEPPDPQAPPPDSAAQAQGEATGQESGDNPSPPESATNPGPTEGSSGEGSQPAEPPKDQPLPDSPKPEAKPSSEAAEASAGKATQPPVPKDVEEVHVIYHHPPDYGYRYGYNPSSMNQGYSEQWHSYPSSPGFRPEPPQPIYVTHSYNTYRASPYVTGYEYIRPPAPASGPPPPSIPQPPQYIHHSRAPPPEYTHYSRAPPPEYTHYSRAPPPEYTHYSRPPPPQYTHYSYSRPESYSEDYHYGNNGNGNITSVFSDENPNACRIV